MKKAIVLQVYGKKYAELFEHLREMFENYAEYTKSDLIIHEGLFDKKNRRSFFAQRMLIPSIYRQYDQILSLDLDVLISKTAKNIFNEFDSNFGFGAISIPRHTEKWKNTVKFHYKLDEILNETSKKYFELRGYNVDNIPESKLTTINGGVLLFNPKIIGNLFYDNYFSNFEENRKQAGQKRNLNNNTDEAFMTFLSIKNDIFVNLNKKFNCLILYELNDFNKAGFNYHKNMALKLILRFQHKVNFNDIFYPKKYLEFVRLTLKQNHFDHFAGGFPYQKLNLNDFLFS